MSLNRIFQHSLSRCYHRSNIGSFIQAQPTLSNPFINDPHLPVALKRFLPSDVHNAVNEDLVDFGEKITSRIDKLGDDCETYPPYLKQYDAWGTRIDEIVTCDGWKQMKVISAEEGLISIAYERKYQEWSRVYQMVKMFLFSPSSGLYSCPLAMTDGAAKILEKLPSKNSVLTNAYSNLTTRDPDKFWTSGQWMTERKGGSDVANGTDTKAFLNSDGNYNLHGYKWFSSATDSDMAFTLARIADGNGDVTSGTEGITLFYLETRSTDGLLNNIQVEKLKDKLGTRQLPTAELLLDGTIAHKTSEEGRGIAEISSMLTLTRIHNAVSAVGAMRRILMLAADYSKKRIAFGNSISEYPLHVQTLARMEIQTRACLLLVLEVAYWLGLDDNNKISDQQALLLRIMTPIVKLFTAKQSMSVVSEGLESFGGQGFIENTGLPKYLRDSQVLPIWEGTTNILSLDVLRSIEKTKGEVLKAFSTDVMARISKHSSSAVLNVARTDLEVALKETITFVKDNTSKLQYAARDLAFSLAHIYIGSLLYAEACKDYSTDIDIQYAARWCDQQLSIVAAKNRLGQYSPESNHFETSIIFS